MSNAMHILIDEALRSAAARFLETQVEKEGIGTLSRLSRDSDDPAVDGYLDVVLSELGLNDFDGALAICSYLGGLRVEVAEGISKIEDVVVDMARQAVRRCFRNMVAEMAVMACGPGGIQ